MAVGLDNTEREQLEGTFPDAAELARIIDADSAFYQRALSAAGVPLDATFVEQKRILGRCSGRFYPCSNGAEARRFNRLLIDAGLIKQL